MNELVIVADMTAKTMSMALDCGPKASDMKPVPWLKDVPLNCEAALNKGWKIVVVG